MKPTPIILFITAILSFQSSFSQCELLFKKYESSITKTIYYTGKDIRLVNAGAVGGAVNIYTQDGAVYFQTIIPVDKETCWDTEKSTALLKLTSGVEVILPFTDASDECDDVSPGGSFLINKENMKKLESSEAIKLTIHFKGYSQVIDIPEVVNDHLMDSNIKAYPRKQLKESMTCLMEWEGSE